MDGSASRPFWSVMIPTYNCAELLADALESVVDQAPGPEEMQIEVVDDASDADDPEAVVRRVGRGRVGFFAQPENVGAPENFTTCIRRATGHWVHILHGDDAVLPGFYDAYRERIERTADLAMVAGPSVHIDEAGTRFGTSPPLECSQGVLVDAVERLAADHPLEFPGVVVARRSYETAGGFLPGLVHANDWEMWTRVASLGPVGCVDEPLALYRHHPGSDSSRLQESGAYVADMVAALDLITSRVANRAARRRVRSAARSNISSHAANVSLTAAEQGRRRAALASALWSVRVRPSRRSLRALAHAIRP